MKKLVVLSVAYILAAASSAMSAGDAAKGEADFKKCKACHAIASADEVIYKGGKTGPNLFGIIGRTVGSVEGYKYGASMLEVGQTDLVWTEELLIEYIADPKAFLRKVLDDSKAKAKMTFKLKNADDVVAYLASVSPADQ